MLPQFPSIPFCGFPQLLPPVTLRGDDKNNTLQNCHLYQIEQQHVIHMAMYSMGRELPLSNRGKVIN